MDKPVPRQWDPAAPSLLWAHAIRREHIHLVNQLDSTRADHTSTLDTIDKLQTRVEDLHQRADLIRTTCEQVNARCNTLIHDVERQMLAVLGRLAVLEAENTQLQKRLDRQESDCAAQAAESTRAIQGLLAQEKVLDARVGDIHSRSDVRMHTASDILVPDSMPKESSGLLLRRGSIRGLSDSTWDSSDGSGSAVEDVQDELDPPFDMMTYTMFKQDGRSLVGYLAAATDAVEARVLPREETAMIREFLTGLDDSSMEGVIEAKLYKTEWSWGCLVDIVGELARSAKLLVGAMGTDAVTKGDGEDGENPVEQKQKEKRRRQRRCIPIVSADEEDLIALSNMA